MFVRVVELAKDIKPKVAKMKQNLEDLRKRNAELKQKLADAEARATEAETELKAIKDLLGGDFEPSGN